MRLYRHFATQHALSHIPLRRLELFADWKRIAGGGCPVALIHGTGSTLILKPLFRHRTKSSARCLQCNGVLDGERYEGKECFLSARHLRL